LAAALTLSLGGAPAAYGAEADVAAGDTAAGVAPQAVTASGDCGPEGNESDVTWSLEDGTLTISGTGAMGSSPWDEHLDAIVRVVIADGVSSVKDSAFAYCALLESVSIPTSVTSIGWGAFSGCALLGSVSIPSSVDSIADFAFAGCPSLAVVNIGEGVLSIGDSAFSECTTLVSVTIPASVATVGGGAFSRCTSLTSITVTDGNGGYVSDGGILFNKERTLLIQYPAGKAGSSYAVPEGVASVGRSAFAGCLSLESVTIPEGVASIGDSAFSYCNRLESVSIPPTVAFVGYYAFEYCASLESVAIPVGVSAVEAYTFQGCESLVSVTIPEGVLSIGENAFSGCIALASLSVPSTVTSIEQWAFSDCVALASVTIPEGVLSVGVAAFRGCTAAIYCEAPSKPGGWDEYWDYWHEGQVVWGQSGPSEPSDTVAPVLSAASAARRSASAATVTLTSSEAGALYWAAVAPGAPAPAIGTAGAGVPLAAGAQALEVAGLATGAAWDVCVVAKDAAGNVSAVLRVGVPAWAYTVTFKGWDGRAIGAAQKVSYGSSATAPAAPPRTGHTFVGWDKGFTGVTADLMVTARYTANSYTVKLDANGGKVGGKVSASVGRAYGTALGKLPAASRTGYVFTGWYGTKSGGMSATSDTAVAGDVTYYAQWRAITYTVKFDANGGRLAKASASTQKAYGSALGALAKPARTGYAFLGWYTGKANGAKVGATTKVTKSVTYYAHWRANGPVVTLNANGGRVGGAATASVVKAKGAALGRLATPKRTGYDFQGWYTGKAKGTKVTAKTRVAKNVTYYAHWKAKSYTVRLAANGGKVAGKASASVKRAYSSKLGKLSIPKRTGYQFLGWYTSKSGGTKVTSATKVTKAVTLYAHWKRAR
jgi:uncharacterized repeat protein (TIGR02543 family)